MGWGSKVLAKRVDLIRLSGGQFPSGREFSGESQRRSCQNAAFLSRFWEILADFLAVDTYQMRLSRLPEI